MTKSVDPQWNKQYQKLVEFQGKNGHCLVPRRYQEDASLADWVSTQRGRHANDTIPLDREVLLNEIGFVLRVPNSAPSWQQQYEKLVEFQRKNGHCIVPQKYEDDKFLGKWVAKQRQLYSKNTIRLDRKKLLDKIGFAWNVNQTWHQQYQKLVAFKQKNGHCLVPKRYQKDASFGEWVITQRQFHKNNKLLRYRKNLLDEIGFVWRVLNSAPARSSTTHESESDSEAITTSVGLPNETLEEPDPGQGHGVSNRFACPSPNIKRPRACLAESGKKAARTNPRRGAIGGSPGSVARDGGRDEEDSKSSQARVQEEEEAMHLQYQEQQQDDNNHVTMLDLLDSQDGVMEQVLGEAPQELPQAATTEEPVLPLGRPANLASLEHLPLGNVQDLLDSPIAYEAVLQLAAERAMERPRACLAESGKMASRTNPRLGAIGISPSSSSQAGVQEEKATHNKLPLGWTYVKLEPDC